MVEVSGLVKIYKLTKRQMRQRKEKENVKTAVGGIDFEVGPGEIFGLLGPNGAGKTTTLRCISTLLSPTEGKIQVCGFTPRYTIRYFGSLYGMSTSEIEDRTASLFKTFGIEGFQDTKIDDLSTGMKQKLSIAVSLIHDPEVVIFDEPTNGLDIVTARTVTDYLLSLKDQGKTIIISTHIMAVAEKLCDRFAVILNGRIAAQGTLEEVLANAGESDLEDAFFRFYQRQYPEEKGGERA